MAKSKLTIVWGGQFGSEGKGAVVAYLHQRQQYDAGVRVGGPNAGHTFYRMDGRKQVVQSVPIPATMGADGYIGAEGLILQDVFLKEMQDTVQFNREAVPPLIYVDKNAAIITTEHMAREHSDITQRIGSTGEGVGAVTADKIMRKKGITVGENLDMLREWSSKHPCLSRVMWGDDTVIALNNLLINGRDVLIEGTQGYGLSLHTSGYYPYATSRECTPQALLAQTGIARENADVFESIVVMRTFPIRVGGNSGPLKGELTWDELKKMTGGYVLSPEITTVTKKQRRIATFDWDMAKRMAVQTRPNAAAVTFFDYLFPETAGLLDPEGLQAKHWEWINKFESATGIPVKYVGTGPSSIIPLRVTR
jgi:adenylosuccinate synthase